MVYDISIKTHPNKLPLTSKFQMKYISQEEIKIWIKVQLQFLMKIDYLKIFIPLFNIKDVKRVDVNFSSGTLLLLKHPT